MFSNFNHNGLGHKHQRHHHVGLLDSYSNINDGYHNDYDYNSNNDLILVGFGTLLGLISMGVVCCICVIIAFWLEEL